jgi:sec-independent protein translocase protein TatA
MFGGIGFQEMLIIGVLAVLLFGKRLPDVARSVGQSYQQFRKGLSDLQGSISTDNGSDYVRPRSHSGYISPVDEHESDSAPKFEIEPDEEPSTKTSEPSQS